MARIGERLLAAGKLSESQLRSALAYQAKWRCRLGEACVAMGLMSVTEVLPTVAEQLHVPYIFIGNRRVPDDLLAMVPQSVLVKRRVLPVRVRYAADGRATLFVATADPTNLKLLDEVGFAARKGVRGVLAGPQDLENALRNHGLIAGRPYDPIELPDHDEEFEVVRGHQALH